MYMEDDGSLACLKIPEDKSIKQRMFRTAGRMARASPEKILPRFAAWNGWMKHCNSKNLKRKLLNRFEYEIKLN